MEELEQLLFQIISTVGTARSNYIGAIQKAKEGNYADAEKLIEDGRVVFLEGHKVHGELIAREASGESVPSSIILAHAEDQLMSAETFGILAKEFIDLYQRIDNK